MARCRRRAVEVAPVESPGVRVVGRRCGEQLLLLARLELRAEFLLPREAWQQEGEDGE